MSNPSLDTHEMAKLLSKSGYSDAQVEGALKVYNLQTQAFKDSINEKLATKDDLEKLKLELKLEMAIIRKDMESNQKETQSLAIKLASLLGAVVVASVGIMTTALGFLMHFMH